MQKEAHHAKGIFALGEDVRITGPDKVVEACKKKLKGLAKNYR